MKTYKIIASTDAYSARRSALMNGNTKTTLDSGLSLKQAQKELLKMLIEKTQSIIPNWGVAVNTKSDEFKARKSFSNGTRSFTIDVITYSIMEEKSKEKLIGDVRSYYHTMVAMLNADPFAVESEDIIEEIVTSIEHKGYLELYGDDYETAKRKLNAEENFNVEIYRSGDFTFAFC